MFSTHPFTNALTSVFIKIFTLLMTNIYSNFNRHQGCIQLIIYKYFTNRLTGTENVFHLLFYIFTNSFRLDSEDVFQLNKSISLVSIPYMII